MALWRSSCKSKSSLRQFKPFYHHFSSLPFHLPAALLGQITRVYFHQFKVMLDTVKRWKIDKYSNNTKQMRRSKFSTVSPVLYNLPPAFQLCFHISTFQDNKKEITKSSPLRIPSKHSKLELGIQIYLLATTHTKILISPNKPQKTGWSLQPFVKGFLAAQQSGSFSQEFKIQQTKIQLSNRNGFFPIESVRLRRHSSEKDRSPQTFPIKNLRAKPTKNGSISPAATPQRKIRSQGVTTGSPLANPYYPPLQLTYPLLPVLLRNIPFWWGPAPWCLEEATVCAEETLEPWGAVFFHQKNTRIFFLEVQKFWIWKTASWWSCRHMFVCDCFSIRNLYLGFKKSSLPQLLKYSFRRKSLKSSHVTQKIQ